MNKRIAQENNDLLLQEDGNALFIEQEDIVVMIGGELKTDNLEAYSLSISNILTNKRDQCNFNIVTHSGDTYLPSIGKEVIILLDDVKVFGGIIVEISSQPTAFGLVRHSIGCQDYTRLLDKRLVPDAFTGQTVNEIMAFLKDRYFPEGFTINNVNADVIINYISFNYKPLAKCIEELAKIINYDWYVDYDRDVHFFSKEAMVSPFDINDSTGTYQYDSLVIRRDNSQVRNTIYVRGGEYLAAQTTFDILTNGTDIVYPSPYKLSDAGAHLTGEILSVGIDGFDDADEYDVLYNFKEKIFKWKTGDKPGANKTLKISGKPNLPVIIKYQASQEVASMASAESSATLSSDGVYEYLIKDDSINTKEAARQRARAEILAYATTLSEGEFTTTTPGLKAGQKININSASRGINEDFVINKVELTQFGKDTLIYRVSLITTRTFDLIDILQKLLLQSTQDITTEQDEIIDTVFNFMDTPAFSDEISAPTTTGDPYKWGSAIWGFGVWN